MLYWHTQDIVVSQTERDLAERLAPGQDLVQCPRCGPVNPLLSEAGQHVKANCRFCGAFIRFLRQKQPELLPVVLRLVRRLNHEEREKVRRALGGAS